jgi:hypothetical protein
MVEHDVADAENARARQALDAGNEGGEIGHRYGRRMS